MVSVFAAPAFFFACERLRPIKGLVMLRREFLAEIEKRGFKITASTLVQAIERGHVTKPEKAADGWLVYTERQLKEFTEYLTRTARKRKHLDGVLAARSARALRTAR